MNRKGLEEDNKAWGISICRQLWKAHLVHKGFGPGKIKVGIYVVAVKRYALCIVE